MATPLAPSAVPAKEGPRTLTLTKYIKLVLPLDGYVFWVKSGIVSESALFNNILLNRGPFNELPVESEDQVQAKGSLHYESSVSQDEAETYTINRVTFTSERPIQDLNAVGPTVMYVGEIDSGIPGGGEDQPEGLPVRFAFSQRQSFFEQAGIHHYIGNAIFSDMQTQIIDTVGQLDTRQIVSNSLPAWLSLNGYQPSQPAYGFPGAALPLFPSFLLPPNLRPPYGSVHISDTIALAASPLIASDGSHSQLAQDRVRITMYGMKNEDALGFVDCVNQFSLDYDRIGIMNMPILRDEKKSQAELAIIAQKKSIDYEVSYLQSVMRTMARVLITSAIPSYVVETI